MGRGFLVLGLLEGLFGCWRAAASSSEQVQELFARSERLSDNRGTVALYLPVLTASFACYSFKVIWKKRSELETLRGNAPKFILILRFAF